MGLRIAEQAGRSDVGRQRSANEDRLVLAPPFFAVADGMGGAKAGEVASALAAGVFDDERERGEAPEAQLTRIVREANRRIYEMAVEDEAVRGMGTTLTAAKVHDDEVSLGHVGDSRAYILRDGELRQLTRDHSLVAELERTGQISAEAAEHHPQRSIITRALGPEPDVEVDTYTVPGRDGDVYLICSDGLTGMLADADVEAIVRGAETLDEAALALIDAANQSGGRDNITVVLFRLEDDGANGTDQDTLSGEQTIAGALHADDVRAAADTATTADERSADGSATAGRFRRGGQSGRAAPRPGAAQRTALAEHFGGAGAEATVVRPPREGAPPRRRARGRRRPARALLSGLVVLLLLGAVVGGLYALSRQVYFVGTNDAGLVTIYRGIPYDLPFGIELYEADYASAVPARAIPAARRGRVLDHEWRGREDAQDLVRQLEQGKLDAGGTTG
ncbi:MAG TPA: Stp1/IreP family PP2C-type Ser/Thr phosphatase [Thermoleophilaceae bacterium]